MKKRIIHILSSNEFSGAENVVIKIIKSLEKEYDFIYASPDGPIRNILKEKNINFVPIEKDDIFFNRLINKYKPDIIHAHDFKASIKIAFSHYKCYKISHLHQNPFWIKRLNFRSLAYLVASFFLNSVVCVSSEIINEAVFSKFISKKTTILKNYIDINNIMNSVEINDSVEEFDIAFVGRLVEVKDPIRFIEIVNEIKKIKKDIKAVMIGDGILREHCKDSIINLGLENDVKMIGFLSNPFKIVNKSRIIVITSKWEGFGLVAVEAMALGKPVIANSVGGLQSIVSDYCGRLCKTNDEFVMEIINLLNDKDKYIELSENCRKNAKSYGSENEWIIQLEKLYSNN